MIHMKIIKIVGDNYFGHYDKTRVACRALVIKEDRVLISYEKNVDLYMLPGGGCEEGETSKECVIREVEEETGNIITVGDPILEIDEYYENEKYITYYFCGNIVGQGKQRLTEGETRDGMEPLWMKLDEIKAIFAKHESYRNIWEEKRGLYLREYTALENISIEY